MPDKVQSQREQAEALSSAIDALNGGREPEQSPEAGIQQLVLAAKLIKAAALPPQAVIDTIVSQAAHTIARKKQKRRLTWGFAGLAGAVAAVFLVVFSSVMMPVSPGQQLAKSPPMAPAPLAQPPEPPGASRMPADMIRAETPAPALRTPHRVPEAAQPDPGPFVPPQSAAAHLPAPAIVLDSPPLTVPADGDTMLALAERKADIVTIDTVTKTVRQVYHKGAPDEIIITQAPKRQNAVEQEPRQRALIKMAMDTPDANQSARIKTPDRNRVMITVGDTEITLEGTMTEEELLNLAQILIRVSVAEQ